MSWPDEPFLNLRQTATPSGTPGQGGQLLYVKSDGKLYTKDAAGVESPVETALGDVTLNGSQTLTNKTISADNNTLSGIAASSFVLSNGSGNIDGSAAQKVIPAGVVVGTTDTQTLTNKTLSTGTLVGAATTDISGALTTYTVSTANITLGTGGTAVGKYVQIGKLVHFNIVLTLGTGGAFTGAPSLSLPVAPIAGTKPHWAATYNDNSAATWFIGESLVLTGSNITTWGYKDAANAFVVAVGATAPFTWAVNDYLFVSGTYEAA